MDDIAKTDGEGLVKRIVDGLESTGAHPARTVVLLPFAQLLPMVQEAWAREAPAGFVPRFETTYSWARRLGAGAPQGEDVTLEMARDSLTARLLIERAGLGAQRDALGPRLVESAQLLAGVVAALPPAQRADWVDGVRPVVSQGLDHAVLALEAAVARIALEWAGASGFSTDVLFEPGLAQTIDCLIVFEGLQPDALARSVAREVAARGVRTAVMPLAEARGSHGRILLHRATDPEDEASRAAACVLRHLGEGRVPVALVSTDRALTRRVRAMLDASGASLRDETGWKLSTTRAAATLMTALRACSQAGGSDTVLDWLKNSPAFAPEAVGRLEMALRRAGIAQWRNAAAQLPPKGRAERALVQQADSLRDTMHAGRPLADWLHATRALLSASGQWDALEADPAGAMVLATLYLPEADTQAISQSLAASPFAVRRLSLAAFMAWANEALEAASFRPAAGQGAQVMILPLHQLVGRPFAAVVVPASDETRLPASPEPAGPWTVAQRAALGLPSREDIAAAVEAAWQHALSAPYVDILWRSHDATGEPVLPSPLVQVLQLPGAMASGDAGQPLAEDPRPQRRVPAMPTLPPLPHGAELPVTRISASAYDDLRRCPYRFFAMRQLGLKEADELDVEVDKRDFGNWLHAVLRHFHEALQAVGAASAGRQQRAAMIDDAAGAVTAGMHLAEDEFLPFAASWPRIRDGYLKWLEKHEAEGAVFVQAERWAEQPVGPLTLIGRLDRVDADAAGGTIVVDYKTEPQGTTRDRTKLPLEDTQLAFYAALLPDDTLRAAYVNVGEKDGTRLFEQPDVVAARDALIGGILHDLARIGEGAALPALGEGSACEFCAARGLCRKDFWETAA